MARKPTLTVITACTLVLALSLCIAQVWQLPAKLLTTLTSPASYKLAQRAPDIVHEYKQPVEGAPLKLYVFYPDMDNADQTIEQNRIAVVFFHGGGWTLGDASQLFPHCTWLAAKGIECISVQYRTASTHDTSPLHAVEDAQDAFTYVRDNRQMLGLGATSLYAAGASAGAHLAASLVTAEYPQFNINRVYPDGVILLGAVIDNSVQGYGYERVKHFGQGFSPLHNLDERFPRTLFLIGAKDTYVPIATAKRFVSTLAKLGVDASLKVYTDAYHSFFTDKQFDEAMVDIETFLQH